MVPVVCKLKELPQIANITGLLVDSDTGGPVADATVTIVDKLNRTLKLEVDDAGSFQFRNVPFGTARLQATAPGYLPTVAPVRINSRKDQNPNLVMNARPSRLGVRIQGGELKIDRPLKFVAESSELTIKSTAMLEEIAVFLMDNPDAGNIEIQVHTDDSGAASYSRRLSQQRADHLMDLLNQLGVKANRLTAKGYGPDQPLVPNINDANRDKNNRVQMVVVKDEQ
jgi:OOP family OmpA-OmpF porin